MIITLENATIGHGLGAEVPPLSLSAGPGVPTVVPVETDERPMLVSMLLGGRLHVDSGAVLIDGAADYDGLRRATALVDTPYVAEPSAGLTLAGVVAEELSFAGLSSSRSHVRTFLSTHGLVDYARLPVRILPPFARVTVFSELALLRPLVSGLILTSPERHGGDPAEWFRSLLVIAQRGATVVVVTDAATADILISLGARDAFAPIAVESE